MLVRGNIFGEMASKQIRLRRVEEVLRPNLLHIVWLKRDLRTQDHAPLAHAIRTGEPVLLLYAFEPGLMSQPESAPRHFQFIHAALDDLDASLRPYGGQVLRVHGEILPVLEKLAAHFELRGLWSHQETGQEWTFRRDQAVLKWTRQKQVPWNEFRQDGVFRRLWQRSGWQEAWENDMGAPMEHPDLEQVQWARLPLDLIQQLQGPPLPDWLRQQEPGFQPGGESFGLRYLKSFYQERSEGYLNHLARPALSRRSCSRLSPYIAFGNLSPRMVFQSAGFSEAQGRKKENLEHFLSRVWWRSHYIQKLESNWRIEFQPMNIGLQSLQRGTRADWLEAWKTGNTGFPMVDASIRCLIANGYLNFRMRAMLVTFAAFPAWQDFKPIATHLARLFLDYEPGIHFGQIQMQCGLTGYHPLRIFNPIHQAKQYDPEGAFVKQWLPALQKLPPPLLYEPWKMTALEQSFYECRIGIDYPTPIFDYDEATRTAKERYWELRMSDAVQEALPAIWERHCLPHDAANYRAEWEAARERHFRKKNQH